MSEVGGFGEGHHRTAFCIVLCGTLCQHDITNDASLDQVVRVVSAIFLCCQVTIFVFPYLVTKSSQLKGIKLHHLK